MCLDPLCEIYKLLKFCRDDSNEFFIRTDSYSDSEPVFFAKISMTSVLSVVNR